MKNEGYGFKESRKKQTKVLPCFDAAVLPVWIDTEEKMGKEAKSLDWTYCAWKGYNNY